MGKMPVHPAAALFPKLPPDEKKALADDIAENGQQHPIITYQGMILDGVNRYEACLERGIEPRFKEYEGKSPTQFVVSMNLKRRHMDTSQRAAIAVELEPMYAEEAKARQKLSEGRGKKGPANLPDLKGDARDKAAKAVKVSGRTVSDAKAVKAAAPEKFEKVKRGELTVNAAKKEIKAEREAVAAPEPDVYRDKEGNIVERPDVIEALQLAEDARMDMAEIEGALRRFVAKWKNWVTEQDTSPASARHHLRYMLGSLPWCIVPDGADKRWVDRGWISHNQLEAMNKIRGIK